MNLFYNVLTRPRPPGPPLWETIRFFQVLLLSLDRPPPHAPARLTVILPLFLTLLLLASCTSMAANDPDVIQWSGDVVLDESFVVPPNRTLQIASGTTVSAEPGARAHIIVHGVLSVEATRADPTSINVNVVLEPSERRTSTIANATLRVEQGTALLLRPEAGLRVDSSTFAGGAVGAHVELSGPGGTRTVGVEVRNSTFAGTSNPGEGGNASAGLWVGGALDAERTFVPPVLVELRNLTFHRNTVGLLVGGDVRSVVVSNPNFRGNDRGLLTHRARVTLEEPTFAANRIQVDAGSGGANVLVTGTKLAADKSWWSRPPSCRRIPSSCRTAWVGWRRPSRWPLFSSRSWRS